MQQLLDIILGFFQEEETKVQNGELKEEDMLLSPYDVQTDDTNTQHTTPHLSTAELKILLVIIRQTYGWIDKRTGRRKTKDRISFGNLYTKQASQEEQCLTLLKVYLRRI